MPKLDAYEEEILSAYEEGELQSVAGQEELSKLKATARTIAIEEVVTCQTKPQGNLADFFAASPLRESGLEIERPPDGPRKVDL